MKIIDLLNKIANNEEVPKFKYYGGTYIYDKETGMYWYQSTWFDFDIKDLNEEVEILDNLEEEKKIPEKLNKLLYREDYATQNACIDDIIRQFNNLLDYLKSKGE